MKCSQQCRYAVNKANKVIGMIKRTITYTDLKIMLNLYKTLVRPHVQGALTIRRIKSCFKKFNEDLRK